VKVVYYWLQWLLVIPAFFVGGCVGAALPLGIMGFVLDPEVKYLWLGDLLPSMFSGFAAPLFCAWVAPKAKRIVCILAALLISMLQWFRPTHWNQIWSQTPMLIGYPLGACLAIACLWWILSRRSISN
jgi:hypothetical protein